MADLLGIRRREAVGILELLFHMTDAYAMRGDIGKFTDRQIAKRVDFDDEEKLVSALTEAGWIDAHPIHRYVVHDWPDHCPEYTRKKVAKAGCGWAVDDTSEPEEPPEIRGDDTTTDTETETSGKFQNSPEKSGSHALPCHALPCHALPSPSKAGGGVGGEAQLGQPRPAPPGRHPPRGKTDPPAALSDEQRESLRAWVRAKPPNDPLSRLSDRDLLRLEEAALDWYRKEGRRQKDWLATVRTWVRNESKRSPASEAPRPRLPEIQRKSDPPKPTPEELAACQEQRKTVLQATAWGRDHLARQEVRNRGQPPPSETPKQVAAAASQSLADAEAKRA